MFECWLTINDKILSSSKEATHSYLKGLQTLKFSHFIKISQIHIWDRGLCKNEYKGQRKKGEWKRKCSFENMDKSLRVKWNPVAPVSESRWHRFLSAAQDITVTYPVTVTSSPHLPPSLTHESEQERERQEGRFHGDLRAQPWDSKNPVLQSGGTEFPSVSRLQKHSHHVGRYPMSRFCPIYFSRDYLLDSFGRMASIWS
jgi:hypothetical protein